MVSRNARRLQPGGFKAGRHSGRFHASNFRGGIVAVSLGSGDGTATVTLEKPMPNADYRVLLCSQTDTDNTNLCLSVSAKTPQSFLITVTSTNQASINVGYLILDNKPKASHGSRFGFHAGYANFRNLQWGKAVITTSGGNGTLLTVKIPRTMKHLPMIFLSFDQHDTAITTGFLYLATGGAPTHNSFIIDVAGCSISDATVEVTWLAFDPGFDVGKAGTFTQIVGNKAGNLAGQKLQSHFGIHSGDFHAKNLFGGVVLMTPSTGDISEAVTFGQMMKQVPIVFAFKQDPVDDATGISYAKSVGIDGATLGIEAAQTDGEASIAYLVFDYEYRQEGAAES